MVNGILCRISPPGNIHSEGDAAGWAVPSSICFVRTYTDWAGRRGAAQFCWQTVVLSGGAFMPRPVGNVGAWAVGGFAVSGLRLPTGR